jgi:large subunit ribosomal protein L31
MKSGIHPEYKTTEVVCSCGSTFTTRSTAKGGEIRVETCSACHPFYTGKQRVLDTAGRVAKFQAKYARRSNCFDDARTPDKLGGGRRSCGETLP